MFFFQLRLKKESFKQKFIIGNKVKKICKKFNTKFLINDDVYLAKKLNSDGCHLGQKDMNISQARKLIGKKIIGVTCHNSIRLVRLAIKNKLKTNLQKIESHFISAVTLEGVVELKDLIWNKLNS